MKRIIVILTICLSFIFVFSACATYDVEPTTEDNEWVTSPPVDTSSVKLSLVSSSESVRAGEQFKLTLNMENCVNFTNMTLNIAYPSQWVVFEEGQTLIKGSELQDAVNSDDGFIMYSLFTQTALSSDGDCAVFTLRIRDDVPSGTVLDFVFSEGTSYFASSDALGVNVENLSNDIDMISCSVTVD